MSGFVRPENAGATPPPGVYGATVHLVMEHWVTPTPGGDKGITVESAHWTLPGAQANLTPDDPSGLRARFVFSVEVQP